MNIIYRNIDEIRPYENNPRKNDNAVKHVKKSIRKFGFKVPIVIDSDGVIVAGHTRYKASLELGLETVPCIVADDLSPTLIKAYRLADNKTAEFAEWDFNVLNLELDDLKLDFDMSDFGFDIEDGISENDFGTEFTLPDGDKGELCQITFTLHNEQAEAIKNAIERVGECRETFGNTNKNGNALYELVMQWAELRK